MHAVVQIFTENKKAQHFSFEFIWAQCKVNHDVLIVMERA